MPARSRLWPDPSVKPPYGAAEIDWGHPLAQGLIGAWILNEGGGPPVDSVVGYRATSLGTGNSWAPLGAGGSFVIAHGGVASVNTPHSAQYNPTTQATLAMGCTLDTHGGGMMCHGDYDALTGVILEQSIAADRAPSFYINGSLQVSATDVSLPYEVGHVRHVAATYNGAGNSIIYIDGAANNSAASTQSSITAATGVMCLGGVDPSRTRYMDGTLIHAFFYRVALAAGLALWLATEPYAMLRPIVRRRYFVPAAAGLSIPVAMHHYTMMRS